jgi:hypothetical protein
VADVSGKSLVGIWLYRDETDEVLLVLSKDGTYQFRTQSLRGVESDRGTYQYADGRIRVLPEGGEPIETACRLLDPDTLEIAFLEEGGLLRLTRQSRMPLPEEGPGKAPPQGSSVPREQASTGSIRTADVSSDASNFPLLPLPVALGYCHSPAAEMGLVELRLSDGPGKPIRALREQEPA